MKAHPLHPWDLTPAQARSLQMELARRVTRQTELGPVSRIAGVDMSHQRRDGSARAAAVVLSYPGLEVVECQVAEARASFPYVPGLLAFREAPVMAAALEKLTVAPDLLLTDGQGLAHFRRFGIACHLGLLFDLPTIGCAKSRLVGQHAPVGETAGSRAELRDGPEVIGAVVRTRDRVAPLYVSIGHRVDLDTALYWVLACCRGLRLPEPLRLAHLAAGGQPIAVTRSGPKPSQGTIQQGQLML